MRKKHFILLICAVALMTAACGENTEEEDVSDVQSWRGAYLEHLEKETDILDTEVEYEYSFIYVDDDDIPELVCKSPAEASGCYIMTYHDGAGVDAFHTGRLYFNYLERKNLLSNSDGHMDYYYDVVYTIENGRWEIIFYGEYYGIDENQESFYDEANDRYICANYRVNGAETDRESYLEAYYAVYEESAAVTPDSYLLKDDLLSFLER